MCIRDRRTMVRKYLVDSCVYWAKEYHIDAVSYTHLMEMMDDIRAHVSDVTDEDEMRA